MKGSSFLMQMVVMAVIALLGAAIYILVINPRIFGAANIIKTSCDVGQRVVDACSCNGQRAEPQSTPIYCCADGLSVQPCKGTP